MATLRLFLLGTFELFLDDKPITDLYSDKTRALLAYLALEANQPHTRGELATLLWPDVEDKKARQNFRQTLSKLQKSIGNQEANPPYLLITRQTVQFNPNCDHWLDVTAVQNNDVSHYRGSLLTHFIVKESTLFEEWLTIQRESLHREVMGLLERLVVETAATNPQQAARYAQRQTELDPWHEEAYRSWMRCLHQAGQSSQAQQVYAQCRKILWDELGVEPETETEALLADIKADAQPSQHPTYNLRPSTLPKEKTPFIGRSAELQEIHGLLQQEDCQLLTLVGLGGAGKTRLAIAAAKQLVAGADSKNLSEKATEEKEKSENQPFPLKPSVANIRSGSKNSYPDGIWFVSLVGAESMLPAIASTLNFPFASNSDPGAQLIDYLADKQLLLVLDNCEELLHERGWLTDLAQAASNIKLLTTSRQPFDIAAEWLFAVEGLKTKTGDEALSDAEELFVAAAKRANARYRFADGDRPDIQLICQRVLGHPLSIELAASWVPLLGIPEIATEINSSLAIFATDSQQFEARHRSLQAIFEYTWQTLSPSERETMGKLAVFQGGFTREAAQQVAGASLLNLLQLVNKALVQRQGDRFGLHEAVRQFATSRAAALPHQAHAQTYVQLLADLRHALQSRLDPAPIETITTELENIRAAWAWQAAHEPVALAAALPTLTLYSERAGLIVEGLERYGRLLTNLPPNKPANVPLRVQLLNIMGNWMVENNREVESRPLLDEALALAQQHHLKAEGAIATTNLALYAFLFREIEKSRKLYKESLQIAEESGDRAVLALCRSRYGRTLENIGHYAEAIEMLSGAVALAESLGRADISTGLYERLTFAYLNAGDHDNMARCAHVYARAAEQMGADQTIAAANYLLGLVYDMQNQHWEAIGYYRNALTIFTRYHIARRRLTTAVHLAGAYQHAGEYALAEEQFLWVKARLDAEEAMTSRANIRGILASLYVDMQQIPKAYAMIREAVPLMDWLSPTSQSMQFFMYIAKLLLADNRPAQAAPFLAYNLQGSLIRERHRQQCEALRAQLPDDVWETAVAAKPTMHTLHQLATKTFSKNNELWTMN
ncbi:AfsR/SARP family transcriptional regulator [Candidatus Leptofilum sp.]|uniref:AfsR/SARP family transcriptional regulator n=1 Tax=Candidatus Leptofilum sp. TaxID=3241576 RepID=UPI003B5B2FDC